MKTVDRIRFNLNDDVFIISWLARTRIIFLNVKVLLISFERVSSFNAIWTIKKANIKLFRLTSIMTANFMKSIFYLWIDLEETRILPEILRAQTLLQPRI